MRDVKVVDSMENDYSSFETSRMILDAIEDITSSDIFDKSSEAYLWWVNGGGEGKLIKYLDENNPEWREADHLNWGDGVLLNDRICGICGLPLEDDDDFYSCPVYIEGKSNNSDEHTSYEKGID